MKRLRFTTPILVAVLLLTSACGFLSVLNAARAVTAASAPVLTRLVARGVITEAQKVSVRTFLDGTTANLTTTRDEWIAATGNRVKEADVIQRSVDREAQIVGALTTLPAEARALIEDVTAAFQIIAAYYGANLPPSMRPPPGAPMVAKPMSQGEMEKAVRQKIEALKQKLQ